MEGNIIKRISLFCGGCFLCVPFIIGSGAVSSFENNSSTGFFDELSQNGNIALSLDTVAVTDSTTVAADSGFVAVTDSGFVAVTDSGFVAVTDSGFVAVTDSGFVAVTDSGFVAVADSTTVTADSSLVVATDTTTVVAATQNVKKSVYQEYWDNMSEEDCNMNISYYKPLIDMEGANYDIKKIALAYMPWRNAFNGSKRPRADLYVDGIQILSYFTGQDMAFLSNAKRMADADSIPIDSVKGVKEAKNSLRGHLSEMMDIYEKAIRDIDQINEQLVDTISVAQIRSAQYTYCFKLNADSVSGLIEKTDPDYFNKAYSILHDVIYSEEIEVRPTNFSDFMEIILYKLNDDKTDKLKTEETFERDYDESYNKALYNANALAKRHGELSAVYNKETSTEEDGKEIKRLEGLVSLYNKVIPAIKENYDIGIGKLIAAGGDPCRMEEVYEKQFNDIAKDIELAKKALKALKPCTTSTLYKKIFDYYMKEGQKNKETNDIYNGDEVYNFAFNINYKGKKDTTETRYFKEALTFPDLSKENRYHSALLLGTIYENSGNHPLAYRYHKKASEEMPEKAALPYRQMARVLPQYKYKEPLSNKLKYIYCVRLFEKALECYRAHPELNSIIDPAKLNDEINDYRKCYPSAEESHIDGFSKGCTLEIRNIDNTIYHIKNLGEGKYEIF